MNQALPITNVKLDRNAKILFRIDKTMKILEIGPSFSPIAPRSQGWDCWVVDHADQNTLKQKYNGERGVDIAKIEIVDFVWRTGDLETAIPLERHGRFDACIASHVLEHLPNPIGFFRSLEKLLNPNGVIALAVPDKRFCFDYFKPLSMTGDFLYANAKNRRRHTAKSAFEHSAYGVQAGREVAWSQHPVNELAFFVPLYQAKAAFDATDESEDAPYVDYHAWYYTPSSFMLVILELNVLGLIDWMVDVNFASEGCEFIVTLKRGVQQYESDAQIQQMRLDLLKGIVRDLKVQYDYLYYSGALAENLAKGLKEPKRRVEPFSNAVGLAMKYLRSVMRSKKSE
jgi:SAM-dependent methyltransferase